MSIVCIDPGHQQQADLRGEPVRPGATELRPRCAAGTRGTKTGTPEYEVALRVARLVATELEARGVDIVMTRDTSDINISNIERTEIATRAGAAVCIRIHCNGVRHHLRYLGRLRSGTATLTPGSSHPDRQVVDLSAKIARRVHRAVLDAGGLRDLGVHRRDDLSGFNWSTVPVVLIELGYLTHPTDERNLIAADWQSKVATAIASEIAGATATLV